MTILKKLKLLLKTNKYSVALVYKAGGIMLPIYFLLNIVTSTLILSRTYILKYIIDSLTASDIQIVFICVLLYVLTLVVGQGATAVKDILYNNVMQKAEHLYDCRVSEKLAELPLSVLDSSSGKNMIDDVRHTKNTAVYATFRMIRILSLLYTFCMAFSVLVRFNLWFSLLFLILTVPGIILSERFDKKAEDLRMEKAPDVRKFSYYRWMLTDAWPAKDVRMYDLTDHVKSRYDEEKKQYLRDNKKVGQRKTPAFAVD